METMRPGSAEELAANLAELASQRRRILLGGAFSKVRMGAPVEEHDVTVATSSLLRVLQFESKDLTISVEAGLPWKALTALLEEHGMMVPLDPPFFDAATVGGVIASNSCGSRRRGYGTARDAVIGMRFATLEGKLVESGGMVVKNVAGLDMGKLLIGSLGTLAAIASVNFKLTPIAQTRSFVLQSDSLAEAIAVRDKILRSSLQPIAIDLLNAPAAQRIGLDGYCLLIQASGNTASLERWQRDLHGFALMEEDLWNAVREFAPAFLKAHPDGCVVRRSGLLEELSMIVGLAANTVPVVARAGSGIAYFHYASANSGGETGNIKSLVEFGPIRAQLPVAMWPSPGPALATMRKVKLLFDPYELLNRGRFYGRI